MEVTIGFNCCGESGLIERPAAPGLTPRVFRIVSGDCLEWMPRDEWHAFGWKRGRTYGHSLPASELVYC
jgi:hypothetical protein